MEYLGKLHQAAVEFPQTDIWMDPVEKKSWNMVKRGIVGANPVTRLSLETLSKTS